MKKIIIGTVLLSLILLSSCKSDKTNGKGSEDTVNSVAESTENATEQGPIRYLYDENNVTTVLDFNEQGYVISRSEYSMLGQQRSLTEYGYSDDAYSVSVKNSDNKVVCTRIYNKEGTLLYQDIYTDEGRERWENFDGLAVKTFIDTNGKKVKCEAYEGDAAFPVIAEYKPCVYSITYYDNEQPEIRNEFTDGVQQKSYNYATDGKLLNVKTYTYDENGRNIRIDQADGDGNITLQVLYAYNETGDYLEVETKTAGVTSAKTEYQYDENGINTGKLVYKYDDMGNAVEYEKWVKENGTEVLEGTYKITE